ncbi:hypothetical protein LUZ62_025673 [Rhynchospora pubera]|uniref:NTF2-like domain-containing protein n=1 Tax=Rhynchospora pubera TaxID=906938 RepID=A0AAV8HE73_9POAL|nr:hypothetical protein LUZ62_025673 [Rhynchospora pubera]
MARALVPIPLTLPYSKNSKYNNSRRFWCAASYNNGRDASPAIKLAVEGVTELLRLFSSKNPRVKKNYKNRESNARNVEKMPPISCVEDVLEIIQDDYQRAYFLTGKFTPDIYAEDCLFEDPTIKFRGRERYGQNLDLLVPFFHNPSLELEEIQKDLSVETGSILASWKLRTYLKLPWRPLISIKGKTTYNLDKDYKIIRHSESWNISAIEAIGQIFGFNSREIDA